MWFQTERFHYWMCLHKVGSSTDRMEYQNRHSSLLFWWHFMTWWWTWLQPTSAIVRSKPGISEQLYMQLNEVSYELLMRPTGLHSFQAYIGHFAPTLALSTDKLICLRIVFVRFYVITLGASKTSSRFSFFPSKYFPVCRPSFIQQCSSFLDPLWIMIWNLPLLNPGIRYNVSFFSWQDKERMIRHEIWIGLLLPFL